MRRAAYPAALLVLALLAGCGTDPGDAGLRTVLSSSLAPPTDRPGAPPVPGGASAAEHDAPRLLVGIEARQSVAVLSPVGLNGPFRTWSTPDRQTLTLRDGLIVATRGLGDDLMSSESGAVRSAMAEGAAAYPRVYRWLDGAWRERAIRAHCSAQRGSQETITLASGRTFAATRVDERCLFSFGGVENTYWLDRNGTLLRSRQWVSPVVGWLTLEPLGG